MKNRIEAYADRVETWGTADGGLAIKDTKFWTNLAGHAASVMGMDRRCFRLGHFVVCPCPLCVT